MLGKKMPISFHGLFDAGTNSLLTLTTHAPIVGFLAEAIPHSYSQHSVNYPRYAESFPLSSVAPSEYPRWAWTRGVGREFYETPLEIQTEEIRGRSLLATAKRDVIGSIMFQIGLMRAQISTGILLQETIYINKKLEAQKLKDDGYTTEALHEFPYVVQYADYAGISIKEAVDEILFQAALDDQVLAKTEIFRIRYFNRIKKARTPSEVQEIMSDYRRDAVLNGLV